MLDERIARLLRAKLEELVEAGEVLPKARMDAIYETFARRFGPDVLGALSGQELLETLHDLGNRESLVYWLEFKNDDDFPALFGSISGGSSLKFGLYRRRETGAWMAGQPTAQRELSIDEAVGMATKHRDELVAGARYLRSLPPDPQAIDYGAVQDELERLAPTVAEKGWAHKYFSLLAPRILDSYHAPGLQRFHLIRMLLEPPAREGRYACARDFALAAQELGVLPTQLGAALNRVNGSAYRYWRIGTTQNDVSLWEAMRAGGYAGIGWYGVPSLSDVPKSAEGKEEVRKLLEIDLPHETPQVRGRSAQQMFNFLHAAQAGDLIVAMRGATVLGIGRVTGEYFHQPEPQPSFPHRRAVEWLSTGEWKLPQQEALQSTFRELKIPANLIAIERTLLEPPARATGSRASGSPAALSGTVEQIKLALQRKGQVILYGPPGTGKTHYAELAARELAARAWFDSDWNALEGPQRDRLVLGTGGEVPAISSCCFHPAYGYEDFIEGYRPSLGAGGQLAFALRDGIFKRLCAAAAADPKRRPHYLIIDEINRGDIPRIFGELLTVLENTRRGHPIILPVSGDPFVVPKNVYLIGTMNTADRSIALLDAALRRRFAFIELLPDPDVLAGVDVDGLPLGLWLRELNRRLVSHLGRDSRNLQIGHSYLLSEGRPITDFDRLRRALRMDIIPLLEEYCYEDYGALGAILGSSLVDPSEQRIRDSLFEPGQKAELIQALLQPTPQLTSSPRAPVTLEADGTEDDLDDDGLEGDA